MVRYAKSLMNINVTLEMRENHRKNIRSVSTKTTHISSLNQLANYTG